MKRWARRTTTGALAATMLLAQAAVTATADEGPDRLDQSLCRAFDFTPEAQVADAWQLQRLGMEEVWRLATGAGIRVAVIDTGVSTLGSPYFDDQRVEAYDYLGLTDQDLKAGFMDCAHGTLVVSLLAAGRSDDGAPLHPTTNFSGIAPDVEVIAYRTLPVSVVSGEDGGAPPEVSLAATIAAVRQAIVEEVDVINLSLMVGAGDPLIADFGAAVQEAIDAGIVVVAAAGNVVEGYSGAMFPASFPGVISVGTTTQQDAPATNSYPGQQLSLGAPGAEIVGLRPSYPRDNATSANQAFAVDTGSSFAAPIVTGVVALLLEYDRRLNGAEHRLTPAEVRTRLMATADPPPGRIPDARIGAGIVNPLRALTGPTPGPANEAAQSFTPPTPAPTPEPAPAETALPLVGVAVGVGAVLLAALGLIAAIAIPAARRAAR